MPYQSRAQKAAIARSTVAVPVRRMRAVRDSSWSTRALCEQLRAEVGYPLRQLRLRISEAATDRDLRTWLAWQLSENRISMGKADPIYPIYPTFPEAECADTGYRLVTVDE